ncbi:hypothetical protein VNO77_36975 [Canavalia gladiata]|uniref:Uncharacterized protein n=1 Tax=Canavalia gladiata TaxID=3824 RepID=A0AAN9K9U1_CANGL
MEGSKKKGTVTSLASVFPVEEAQKAAKRVEDAIAEKQNEFDSLRGFVSDNNNLINLVQKLPEQLSHDIMVPFGKAAFLPGRLIHTNEFLVLLGEGYYAERTSKQTVEILQRRGKSLDSQVDSLEANIKDLQAEAAFFNATASEVAIQFQGCVYLSPSPPSATPPPHWPPTRTLLPRPDSLPHFPVHPSPFQFESSVLHGFEQYLFNSWSHCLFPSQPESSSTGKSIFNSFNSGSSIMTTDPLHGENRCGLLLLNYGSSGTLVGAHLSPRSFYHFLLTLPLNIEKLLLILAGLPDNLDSVHQQILTATSIPSMENVFGFLFRFHSMYLLLWYQLRTLLSLPLILPPMLHVLGTKAVEGLVEIREDYVEKESNEEESKSGIGREKAGKCPPQQDDPNFGNATAGDDEYARILSKMDELEKEELAAESGNYNDQNDETTADFDEGHIDINLQNSEDFHQGVPLDQTNKKIIATEFPKQHNCQEDIANQLNFASLAVQSKTREGGNFAQNVESIDPTEKIPIRPREIVQATTASKIEVQRQISQPSFDSRKAFTGTIIEHAENIQTTSREQSSTSSQVSGSQSSKPVSRFKMQRR